VYCRYIVYCIQVLLKAGANPDARDSYDNSALLLACETGSYNIAKLLVEHDARVELQHAAGRGTAMHQVGFASHAEVTTRIRPGMLVLGLGLGLASLGLIQC